MLYDHAGVRDLTVDDHRFTVAAGEGWAQATFRLQLFTGADVRPVAVITQVVPDEGAGPINHAERYAEAIWRQCLPDEPAPPIIIGHMLSGDQDGLRDLGWAPVDITVADAAKYSLERRPIWGGRMSPAELEYLVGRPVDPNRGAAVTAADPARVSTKARQRSELAAWPLLLLGLMIGAALSTLHVVDQPGPTNRWHVAGAIGLPAVIAISAFAWTHLWWPARAMRALYGILVGVFFVSAAVSYYPGNQAVLAGSGYPWFVAYPGAAVGWMCAAAGLVYMWPGGGVVLEAFRLRRWLGGASGQ